VISLPANFDVSVFQSVSGIATFAAHISITADATISGSNHPPNARFSGFFGILGAFPAFLIFLEGKPSPPAWRKAKRRALFFRQPMRIAPPDFPANQ